MGRATHPLGSSPGGYDDRQGAIPPQDHRQRPRPKGLGKPIRVRRNSFTYALYHSHAVYQNIEGLGLRPAFGLIIGTNRVLAQGVGRKTIYCFRGQGHQPALCQKIRCPVRVLFG